MVSERDGAIVVGLVGAGCKMLIGVRKRTEGNGAQYLLRYLFANILAQPATGIGSRRSLRKGPPQRHALPLTHLHITACAHSASILAH
ncbi:unnamed protein product [Danaus chrysippus]|uniref:(African queen) hypothetical protein n=1 Tax=Danaus chrysippus TaxID=151541 RepID=A0A8J2W105_9NEOP|nr:unnamed protein product [Danaus chrysippus]